MGGVLDHHHGRSGDWAGAVVPDTTTHEEWSLTQYPRYAGVDFIEGFIWLSHPVPDRDRPFRLGASVANHLFDLQTPGRN